MKPPIAIVFAFIAANLVAFSAAAGLPDDHHGRHLNQYKNEYDSRLKCQFCYDCKDDSDDEPAILSCPINNVCVKLVDKSNKKIYRDCGKREMLEDNGKCSYRFTYRDGKAEGCLYACNDEDECNGVTSQHSISGQWTVLLSSLVLLLSCRYL